jgi:phage FluMu protein Com
VQPQEDSDDAPPAPTVRDVPVLVVCTSGLPRDAFVETEVVGFVNNSVPAAFFKYVSSTSLDVQHAQLEGLHKGADCVMTEVVDSWPMWTNPKDVIVAPAAAKAEQEPLSLVEASDQCYIRAESCATVLARSLCVGFVRVECPQDGTVHNTVAVSVDVAAAALVAEVRKILHGSQLHKIYLRSLRVYHDPSRFAMQELMCSIVAECSRQFGTAEVPAVVMVPVLCVGLEGSDRHGRSIPLLAAQVTAWDLAQLDTEAWIHVME